jgi:hypothetical protein
MSPTIAGMTNAEYLRARREKFKALGFCGQCCKNKVSPGLLTCEACLVKKRELDAGVSHIAIARAAKEREARIEAAYQRRLARDRKRSRERYADPVLREAEKAKARDRYWRNKSAGKCVHCSAGIQEDDSVYCVDCYEQKLAQRKTAKGRKARLNSQRRLRAKRRALGVCLNCARPRAPNRLRCHKCLADMVEWQQKHRDRKRETQKARAA